MNSLKCDQMLLMQYYDGELGSEEEGRVKAHVAECGSCSAFIREAKALSTLFRDGFQPNIAEGRALNSLPGNREPVESPALWNRIMDLFRIRRALIPALALTAMLIAVFSFDTDVRSPAMAGEPSAIINSFSGDVSTVMFLETPETHQTIIWYEE